MTIELLESYFLQYGEIEDLRLFKENGKEYSFVLFKQKESLDKVLSVGKIHSRNNLYFCCDKTLLKHDLITKKRSITQTPSEREVVPQAKQAQNERRLSFPTSISESCTTWSKISSRYSKPLSVRSKEFHPPSSLRSKMENEEGNQKKSYVFPYSIEEQMVFVPKNIEPYKEEEIHSQSGFGAFRDIIEKALSHLHPKPRRNSSVFSLTRADLFRSSSTSVNDLLVQGLLGVQKGQPSNVSCSSNSISSQQGQVPVQSAIPGLIDEEHSSSEESGEEDPFDRVGEGSLDSAYVGEWDSCSS